MLNNFLVSNTYGQRPMIKILLYVFSFFICSIGCAQGLSISVGAEMNVSSTESQFMMGYQSNNEWSLGVFYQNKCTIPLFEQSKAARVNEWFGVFLIAPIVKTKKISFYGQLRAGLVNDRFLLLTPSLETKIKITKWLAIGTGSSYRYGYPTFLFKTHISLLKRNP